MGLVWTFLLSTILFSLSPSLWETAQYRLKYCLKRLLNQKQPTNLFRLTYKPFYLSFSASFLEIFVLTSQTESVGIMNRVRAVMESENHTRILCFTARIRYGLAPWCMYYTASKGVRSGASFVIKKVGMVRKGDNKSIKQIKV